MRTRWISSILATLVLSGPAIAQPVTRDHRKPAETKPEPPRPDDRRAHGANDHRGPREAPPAPRAETPGTKDGYVWIAGRWEWKNTSYEWTAGHWERPRANKSWREGRWDKRGDEWAYVEGTWADSPANQPPPSNNPGGPDRPRDAPPPRRDERHDANRPGYVWVDGDWDWKGGKYEWTAGHWERERAGKRWRASRWEQRDGAWARVDGDWEDGTVTTTVTTTTTTTNDPNGPGPNHRPRREWKLERPLISNYWPAKGKPGTTIVIRGMNFPKDATVMWGGRELRGVKVKDDELRVVVPPDAVTGIVSVRAGRGRDLAVGTFEVAAAFDPIAEQRRIEEESRKRAEAAWADRQRALAKDRAAREAAWKTRWQEREANRDQRRADREAEIRGRYARAFLADAETQDELTLHAQRVAELTRMSDIADIKADGKIAVRIGVLRSREDERHEQRMAALDASFRDGGAQ